MADTANDTLVGRAPQRPCDFHVINGSAGQIKTRLITDSAVTHPRALTVVMEIRADTVSPTALQVHVAPNVDGVNPTITTTLTGMSVYMEDIGSATVNHLIAMDIGINSNNLAENWHTFMRLANHGGTAKSIFVINAKANYLFDFQGADGQAPVSASSHSTNVDHKIACRLADGTTRYLQLSTD